MNEFRANRVVREPNQPLRAAALAFFAGALGLLVLTLAMNVEFGGMAAYLAICAASIYFATAWTNAGARWRPRDVRATGAGITFDAKAIARAKIADGLFQPGRLPSVQLVDRWKRVMLEVEVASENEGVELLCALGLDASSKRAEFRVRATRPADRVLQVLLVAPLVFLIIALPRSHGMTMSGPILLLAALGFGVFVRASRLVVGVDGIHLRSIAETRFISMSEVLEVVEEGNDGVRICCRSGKDEVVTFAGRRRREGGRQRRDALMARIREARVAFLERAAAPDVIGLLARAGRPLAAWQRSLGELADQGAGYRRAAIATEDLWRVVEDPRAPVDARAAAALVLRSSLDDGGKARVRLAAEATASPKLRVALDTAATGTDDELGAALEEMEDEIERERAVKATKP